MGIWNETESNGDSVEDDQPPPYSNEKSRLERVSNITEVPKLGPMPKRKQREDPAVMTLSDNDGDGKRDTARVTRPKPKRLHKQYAEQSLLSGRYLQLN